MLFPLAVSLPNYPWKPREKKFSNWDLQSISEKLAAFYYLMVAKKWYISVAALAFTKKGIKADPTATSRATERHAKSWSMTKFRITK